MIHDAAGAFLLKYRYGTRSNVRVTHDPSRKKAAVIIETRDNFWLPMVLRNFVSLLKDWNFYFMGPLPLISSVRERVKGDWQFVGLNFPENSTNFRLNMADYNKLLTGVHKLSGSETMWDHIKEEHIMVFQSDCICFRNPVQKFLDWDYIGAICGNDRNEENFVMNGGLSLRKKSAMQKVCAEFEEKGENLDGSVNEDVMFTDHMRANGYNIPGLKDCNHFVIETGGDAGTCIGLHGTEKYWIDNDTMGKVMKYAEHVAL